MNEEIIVEVGKYHVAGNPAKLICIGLGSCIAVALYDPKRNVGGLAHAMLPNYIDGVDKRNPGKYVDTSIYLMVDEIIEMGSKKGSLKAKLVGGAQMFSFIFTNFLDIGSKNIEIAKETLKQEGIPLIGKNVGGSRGRTISFDIKTGKIEIRVSGNKKKIL